MGTAVEADEYAAEDVLRQLVDLMFCHPPDALMSTEALNLHCQYLVLQVGTSDVKWSIAFRAREHLSALPYAVGPSQYTASGDL